MDGIINTIIVPTKNEESGIGKTLGSVFSYINRTTPADTEVVVVDGHSHDATLDIIAQYPCRLVLQPVQRLGKGNGLRAAFSAAKGKYIVWIDADDTYPVEYIPTVLWSLHSYDAVVCSRKWGKENMPKFNRFGNWLFKILIKTIYGFKAGDPCSGLYGMRKSCLDRMKLTSENFAIEPEISIKCGRMKLRTLDIPIRYRIRVGATKLNAIKVGLEDMWTIVKLISWKEDKSCPKCW